MFSKLMTAALVMIAAGAPAALGGDPQEPVLKGPQVTDGGVPGSRRAFGDGQGGDLKQKLADRPIPQMQFMRALGVLRDENTPASARLTDDQQQKIRAINQEFEQSMRSFREAHKGEFEEMRGQFGDRGRPQPPRGEGKPGDGEMQPPPPPPPGPNGEGGEKGNAAARQKFEELRAQAPNPKDAQAKIFAVLTDEQKPLVQQKLEEVKKEMTERGLEGRARAEVQRRLAKQGGKGNGENLPPKLREKLESMTPEEREQAVQKFRERFGNGEQRRGPGPEALPEDLRETWESLTPEERQFLIQKLRERAAEEGKDMPPPRRRPKPQDAPPPPKDE
ncbi:MAG: hypothetical protein U0570_03395 [Phycisphaerales bacterium]